MNLGCIGCTKFQSAEAVYKFCRIVYKMLSGQVLSSDTLPRGTDSKRGRKQCPKIILGNSLDGIFQSFLLFGSGTVLYLSLTPITHQGTSERYVFIEHFLENLGTFFATFRNVFGNILKGYFLNENCEVM